MRGRCTWKLDEVIRAIRTAHNDMINIEKLSDAELEELSKRYDRVRSDRDAVRNREKLKFA